MNDKYRMFKNYMYNDLGITKADIMEWTKEAVSEVAVNYIARRYSDYELDKEFRNAVTNALLNKMKFELADNILQSYDISLVKKANKEGLEHGD